MASCFSFHVKLRVLTLRAQVILSTVLLLAEDFNNLGQSKSILVLKGLDKLLEVFRFLFIAATKPFHK